MAIPEADCLLGELHSLHVECPLECEHSGDDADFTVHDLLGRRKGREHVGDAGYIENALGTIAHARARSEATDGTLENSQEAIKRKGAAQKKLVARLMAGA